MSNLWTAIEGWKVYILCAVGALAVIVNHFLGPIPGLTPAGDDWLQQLWDIMLIAAGRSALRLHRDSIVAAVEESK